jgi:hypothetical protein
MMATKRLMNWRDSDSDTNFVGRSRACPYQFRLFGKIRKFGRTTRIIVMGRDAWMPAVQTMDCSASTDCDQIFTELVEKRAPDFGVIESDIVVQTVIFTKWGLNQTQFAERAP